MSCLRISSSHCPTPLHPSPPHPTHPSISYERSYPYYNGTYTESYHRPNQTVYVVNGAAGNIEGVENLWHSAKEAPWR